MTRKKWKEQIIAQMLTMQIAQDPEKVYQNQIDALATVLEQRDKTFAEFKQDGRRSVVEYTNKNGSTNATKNPLLMIWDDLNKTALSYWRELGMTPASYRKLTGDPPKRKEEKGGLAAALAGLGAG